MIGVEHAGCVLGVGQGDGALAVPGRDLASRFALPRASLVRARPASSCTRCQTFPGQGPTNGPWDGHSREWSAMPVSSRASAASVLVVPHVLVNPQHSNPCETGGAQMRPCRHGLIGGHTVFHVVPHWRASPKIVTPSTRSCRIAQRIARTPRRARGVHTFSLYSRNVTVWQVVSRRIQRRIVPPDP